MSSDLKPIENIWACYHIKFLLEDANLNPYVIYEIIREWARMDQNVIEKLNDSMPRRL